MSTLKDSFAEVLINEEIEAEWELFQREYNDWNAHIAAEYAKEEDA